MAQHVLIVDAYRGGVGTYIYQCASRTALSICQYAVGQCQWSQVHLCNGYTSHIETLVQFLIKLLPPQDIQEVTLQTRTLDTYGIHLVLIVNLIFLCGGIEDFLILITHIAVSVHQFVNHLLGNDSVGRQVLYNNILYTTDRLSSNTYIYMCDVGLQDGGELLHNV